MVDPGDLEWRPLPKEWTDGAPPPGFDPVGRTEVAIVSGDPSREGAPYVIRLRSTPSTRLPVHWHPNDEHITVLSGTWCVGSDRFDERACRDMPAGSYVFVPKGSRHFAVARGNVVQIHGVGLFKVVFVRSRCRRRQGVVAATRSVARGDRSAVALDGGPRPACSRGRPGPEPARPCAGFIV